MTMTADGMDGASAIAGEVEVDAPQLRVAIVGTPRSGTTILAKILGASLGAETLVEPFNPIHGIAAATRRYMSADRGDLHTRAAIDTFLAGTGGDFRLGSPAHRLASWIRPGSNLRTYRRVCRRPPPLLIIKDPFLALSARYLVEAHGFRIIWALRHPAAVLSSFDRLGWDAGHVMDDWRAEGRIDSLTYVRANDRAARLAILWTVINRHLADVRAARPGTVLAVRHEDFCHDPSAQLATVTRHCGLAPDPIMQAALARAIGGTLVRPAFRRVHALRRNAGALPDAWRGQIDATEDATMRTLCEAAYDELYDMPW